MSWRQGICGLLIGVLAAFGPAGTVVRAGTAAAAETPGADVAGLQEQLEGGLRARLPPEFAFIKRVVTAVETGRLPIALVKSTFAWARRKKQPYPFPYFERALKLRAAEQGLTF